MPDETEGPSYLRACVLICGVGIAGNTFLYPNVDIYTRQRLSIFKSCYGLILAVTIHHQIDRATHSAPDCESRLTMHVALRQTLRLRG